MDTIKLHRSAAAIFLITAIILSTLISVSYSASLISANAKLPKCGTLSISSNVVNAIIATKCKWNGGHLNIFAASGNTGAFSVMITNSIGSVYYSASSITSWCNTYVGSPNLPAQTYNVVFHLGQGGGKCGNATLSLITNPKLPSCLDYKTQTLQKGQTVMGMCKWTGGTLDIYAGAGSAGGGSYSLKSQSTGLTYASNGLATGCAVLMDTVNAPAQRYVITLSTGSTYGSCGNSIVELK